MEITVYSQNGSESGKMKLNAEIFDIPTNKGLVHQALIRQRSNWRSPIAHTKTRGERRGGGIKPFKQKGTGRARAGSRRSPLWRKGGITFGPRGVEMYATYMPRKQRLLALFGTLSQKARDNQIIGLEEFTLEKPQTKAFAVLVKKLPIERSCLLVMGGKNDVLQQSARNIPNVKVIHAQYLNVVDLLQFQTVLCMKDAIAMVDTLWGETAKELASSRARKEATAEKKK